MISSFTLLYCIIYSSIQEGEFAIIVVLAVIAVILGPPKHFLRMTVYSFWLVVILLFLKDVGAAREGISLQFFNIIVNMESYILSIIILGFFAGLLLNYYEREYKTQNLYVIVVGIVGSFILVPLTLFLGSIIGLYRSLYVYLLNLITILRVEPVFMQSKYENYLAHKAIEDWESIWKNNFKLSRYEIKEVTKKVRFFFSNYRLVLACYYSFMKFAEIILLAIANFIFTTIFSLIHFVILIIFKTFYELVRYIFSKIDSMYRKIHQVEMVCPSCYHKAELPVYVCAHCKRMHGDLKPSHFGIFKRKCACGHKMPTSILLGRSKLHAQCPGCHEEYNGRESTPIIIPIIGDRMAGKTSFWTHAIQTLSFSLLKENDISFNWGTTEQKTQFEQLVSRVYAKSTPPVTKELIPKAWTLHLNKKKWARAKVLHLYDPSGVAFERSDFMKKMNYLSYADGIILVIDASTLNLKKASHQFDQRTFNNLGGEEIIDRLLLYYQEEVGVKVHEKIKTPIAIVFHKMDKGMDQQVVKEVSATEEGINPDHVAIKQWLHTNGSQNFLRKLDHQFTNYQFFISSSYSESNEVQPSKALVWILNYSKKGLKLVEKGE